MSHMLWWVGGECAGVGTGSGLDKGGTERTPLAARIDTGAERKV
jgi:hypothetical protein